MKRSLSLLPVFTLLAAVQSAAQTTWTCGSDILFEGAQIADHMGWSIATNGNWNGDSYPGGVPKNDVLAGGFKTSQALGAVQLFTSSGAAGFPISPGCPFPDGRVRITGEEPRDYFGHSVDFIGDIEGDGRDDFIVGMVRGPIMSGSPTDVGAVYLFASSDPRTGMPVNAPQAGVTDIDAADASIRIEGVTAGGRFGHSIAGIGDWNDDGVPDFVVGAPGGDAQGSMDPGRAYLVSGAKVVAVALTGARSVLVTAVLMDETLDPAAGANGVILGDNPTDRLGYVVAHVGEAGLGAAGADFAVGAPQFQDSANKLVSQLDNSTINEPGYVRVFLGENQASVRIDGSQDRERFGFSIAGKANINGDANGIDEVIIGAPFWRDASHTHSPAGRVTVWQARTATQLAELRGSDAPAAPSFERLGFAVAGLGNLNGTGGDEFAVGSFGYFAPVAGPFYQPDESPCDPCPKIDEENGLIASVGGAIAGRAQVISLTGSGLVSLQSYLGDFRDSAGASLAFLPHVGPGARPAVVVGAFRWGDTAMNLNEVGRVHVFPW